MRVSNEDLSTAPAYATALATWHWSALSNPHSGIKWRIEINKIDTRVGKFAPVAQPLQIVAEIEPIHWITINQNSRSEKVIVVIK